jgi:hypothetical protein
MVNVRTLEAGITRHGTIQMYFGTQAGWTTFEVDINEDETLQSVLPDVLRELEESGHVLKGGLECPYREKLDGITS